MEYRIFVLKDERRIPEITELFRKGLGETDPGYWKWKHFSENGLLKGMFAAAETAEGKLVGMFPMQPALYACGEKKLVAVKAQDLVIDPEHRGTGLMKQLFTYAAEHCRNQGADGFISFCNDKARAAFLRYGARDGGDICGCRTPKRILPLYSKRVLAETEGFVIRLSDALPTDLFFSGGTNEYRMEKNETFMRWKFSENPERPYRWLTVRKNGVLKGYMAVYVVQGRLRRAVNIADWELDDAVTEKVLRAAVKLLSGHGNWVNLWGRYSADVLSRWAKAGLNRKSAGATHFVLYDYAPGALPENWQFTRADLDF